MGSSDRVRFLFDFKFRWIGKRLAISLLGSKERWRFVSSFLLLVLPPAMSSGAFLIPYFVLYFLIGAPLYFMELALGQFTSRGPGTGFKMARGWQGQSQRPLIVSSLSSV